MVRQVMRDYSRQLMRESRPAKARHCAACARSTQRHTPGRRSEFRRPHVWIRPMHRDPVHIRPGGRPSVTCASARPVSRGCSPADTTEANLGLLGARGASRNRPARGRPNRPGAAHLLANDCEHHPLRDSAGGARAGGAWGARLVRTFSTHSRLMPGCRTNCAEAWYGHPPLNSLAPFLESAKTRRDLGKYLIRAFGYARDE
jgi:hypothetical protein